MYVEGNIEVSQQVWTRFKELGVSHAELYRSVREKLPNCPPAKIQQMFGNIKGGAVYVLPGTKLPLAEHRHRYAVLLNEIGFSEGDEVFEAYMQAFATGRLHGAVQMPAKKGGIEAKVGQVQPEGQPTLSEMVGYLLPEDEVAVGNYVKGILGTYTPQMTPRFKELGDLLQKM